MKEKLRKKLLTALKIIVSMALLYFIFTKITLHDVLNVLKFANPIYLVGALLFFVLSKIFNALRLNLYFHHIGAPLSQKSNLKLYLLGMFYNLFLPGGIGGDAYKGYVVQKQYQTGTKKVITALLVDRLSGMLLIFIYGCILVLFLPQAFFISYSALFLAAIPLSVFTFWMLQKKISSYLIPVFWKSFWYSLVIQLLQLVSVVFILKSLSITTQILTYLFVFLTSSIVSVVPLTIGGIGSRELTFLYGAKWLDLNADTSVAVSMVFFLITALVSLFGIYYHFKKPELAPIAQ